jgi:hypothetical protein
MNAFVLDKTLQSKNAIQNISVVDRIIRLIVGFSMLGVVLFIENLSPGLIAFFGLLSIIPILSGIMGWCPFYAMFNVRSCSVDNPHNRCGTLPFQISNRFH